LKEKGIGFALLHESAKERKECTSLQWAGQAPPLQNSLFFEKERAEVDMGDRGITQ
jgi:hypothetical protein